MHWKSLSFTEDAKSGAHILSVRFALHDKVKKVCLVCRWRKYSAGFFLLRVLMKNKNVTKFTTNLANPLYQMVSGELLLLLSFLPVLVPSKLPTK